MKLFQHRTTLSRTIWALLVLGLLNLVSYGQAAAKSSPTLADQAVRVGAGDTLDVTVFDTPELSFRGRVSDSGDISLPVGGQVHVAGLDTYQAARAIEDRLQSQRVMLAPGVRVTNIDFATQGIAVLGEVNQPGTYTLLGPHTLYDALAAAGGTTATQGKTITITRAKDKAHPEVIDVTSPDYSTAQHETAIFPGDLVFVSKAEKAYIVGDVAHAGAFYMTHGKPLSVLNILSLAQGDNDTAKLAHTSIVRTTKSGVVTIPVDIDKIKKAKRPDIALQDGDVVVVPRSGLKVFLSRILPGVSTSVTSSVATALIVR